MLPRADVYVDDENAAVHEIKIPSNFQSSWDFQTRK